MGLRKEKIRERDAVERKLEASVGGRKSSGKRECVWLTAEVGVLVLDAGEGGGIDGVRREGLRGKECGERGGVRELNWGCRSTGGRGQGEGGASSRGDRFQ